MQNMSNRRSYGSGSISKREDGRSKPWICQYKLTPKGKRQTISFSSEDEAIYFLNRLQINKKGKREIDPGIYLSELIDLWLEDRNPFSQVQINQYLDEYVNSRILKKNNIRYNTFKSDKSIVLGIIKPSIPRLRLIDICEADVHNLLKYCEAILDARNEKICKNALTASRELKKINQEIISVEKEIAQIKTNYKNISRAAPNVREQYKNLKSYFKLLKGKIQTLEKVSLRQPRSYGRTLERVLILLRAVFKFAIDEKYISENPMPTQIKIKYEPKQHYLITLEDFTRICFACCGTSIENLPDVAGMTGLRKGELTGLRMTDYDMKNNILRVSIQIQRLPMPGKNKTKGDKQGFGTSPQFCPPKKAREQDYISVTQELADVLKRQLLRIKILKSNAGERWQENDLIFPSKWGTPLEHRTIDVVFQRAVKKCEITTQNITFHDLRHFFISHIQSGAVGASPKIAGVIVGQRDVRSTGIYTHPDIQDQKMYMGLFHRNIKKVNIYSKHSLQQNCSKNLEEPQNEKN